jgi:hypothetical protein
LRRGWVALLAALATLLVPAAANAADTIYWGNEGSSFLAWQESAATTVAFTEPISLSVKCETVAPGRKWRATMSARTSGGTSKSTASGGRIPLTTGQVTCTVLKANPDTALFAATNLTPSGGPQLQGTSQTFTPTAAGPAQIVYTLSLGTASITMTFKLTVV